MSRPKVGVTLNNFIAVRAYFKSALKDGRLWDSSAVLDDDFIDNAERAFRAVFFTDEKTHNNEKASVKEQHHLKSCAALQIWIDNFRCPPWRAKRRRVVLDRRGLRSNLYAA